MKIDRAALDRLCAIAEAAAREIMEVYASDFESWSKDDASPITQADLRADAVIRQSLERDFPDVFIWSEESTSNAPRTSQAFFLVDPLDGTREFLKRNGEFTVNIAWIDRGEPVAGVVLAPVPGEVFYAARGLGAWKRKGVGATQPLKAASVDAAHALRVIGSRSHGVDAQTAWLAQLPQGHSFVAAGSSLKFCRLAEGAADLYPRFGPTSQWDTAAGHAVLQEAGGAVLGADRQPLRYGLERPVLNPHFVALGDPTCSFPEFPQSA